MKFARKLERRLLPQRYRARLPVRREEALNQSLRASQVSNTQRIFNAMMLNQKIDVIIVEVDRAGKKSQSQLVFLNGSPRSLNRGNRALVFLLRFFRPILFVVHLSQPRFCLPAQ